MRQLLADLEALHSRSRYLEAASDADIADCPVSEQSQQPVGTQTDVCVDSEKRQSDEVDAVTSASKQDGLSDKLERSITHLPAFDSSRMSVDSNCMECQLPFTNIKSDCSTMYLHAYCYQVKFIDWNYCDNCEVLYVYMLNMFIAIVSYVVN